MSNPSVQEEVLAFLRLFERAPRHAFHVAELARQLFDELAPLHGLGERERELLEAAAYLHDIGSRVAPAGKNHHKESARLIEAHSWEDLTPLEVCLVALMARYHRKDLPGLGDKEFAALTLEDQRRVQILAALLRIADGLDSSHQQSLRRVQVETLQERLVVHFYARGDTPDELAAARKKSDLAERVFGREIQFAAHLLPAM